MYEFGLDRVEEFYRSREAASIIHVTPWSHASLTNALAKRGYAICEYQNVFVRPVALAPPAANDAVRVELVEDEAGAELWLDLSSRGFASEEMSAEVIAEVMGPFAGVTSARCYVAFVGDAPAGAATAVLDPDLRIAGFYGASTLPEMRRRGVQTALLRRRLGDAAEAGCELAMVTTAPGSSSHRNVARQRFELAYAKVSMRRAFETPAAE